MYFASLKAPNSVRGGWKRQAARSLATSQATLEFEQQRRRDVEELSSTDVTKGLRPQN